MASEPKKILIVEDSPTMCQLYRLVLGRSGHELVFASNGVEGLDRAAQETDLDLLIADINMPQMDGLELIRRVRTDLGLTDLPAIVISTEGEDADREAARTAGANAYLRKPWTPEQLLSTVSKTLTTGAA